MSNIHSDNIIPIRALKDNYVWTLIDKPNQKAFVIDPGDASPVIDTLEQLHYSLAGIMITHHHPDHSGGISDLLDYAGDIPVIASHRSRLNTINQKVKEGDTIDFAQFNLTVMEIPGHTLDHIAFYIDSSILFSGDTLFSGGCGRIFEGNPKMMFDSLNNILQLQDATRLYCGHEYTIANLSFAQTVEPHNQEIAVKIEAAKKIVASNGCTLPSTLRDQKNVNPFLRCHIPDVIHAAEKYANAKLSSPLQVFTAIREWKNNWKQI